MKKYFLSLLAVICAISLSAFTKPAKRVTSPATMVFLYDRTNAADLVDRSKWIEGGIAFGCNYATPETACTIQVDPKYTHPEGWADAQKFNLTDPDGNGPELEFPSLTAENGVIMNGVQYKRISTSINIVGEIEVKNGSVL